jgi:SAM-dependent methyltransferase
VKQVRTIAVREIIQTYRQTLGMEVTQYFRDHSVVEVLRCLDTGYTFYYPFDIFADAQFYEQLSKNSWYYQQNSWEHSVACTRIEAGARVLEVGAGDGAFLEQVSALGAVGVGLELNPSAVAAAQGYRRQVIRETLQRHIARVCTPYDVVCLFQVLEHLSDPVSVLRQAISVLKPGGLLIIAVPNNDQNKRSLFVRRDDALNLPPHHAALWATSQPSYHSHLSPYRLSQQRQSASRTHIEAS